MRRIGKMKQGAKGEVDCTKENQRREDAEEETREIREEEKVL